MYDFLVALIVCIFYGAVIITMLLWINEFSRYKKGDKEMNENLIPKIAEMLGVTLNEKFKIDKYGNRIFEFSDDSLWERVVEGDDENQYVTWNESLLCLKQLLNGNAKVIKLPWKPKVGDTFYTFDLIYGKWVVCSFTRAWIGSPSNYALLDKGWIYRTAKEALQNLPKVAKEYDVPYSLNGQSYEED